MNIYDVIFFFFAAAKPFRFADRLQVVLAELQRTHDALVTLLRFAEKSLFVSITMFSFIQQMCFKDSSHILIK